MIYLLKFLSWSYGPFRMAGSHMMLICIGAVLSFFLSLIFLPFFWGLLPYDRGKELTPDGGSSKNKPTGAGLILFLVSLFSLLLVLPVIPAGISDGASFSEVLSQIRAASIDQGKWYLLINRQWMIVLCLAFAMVVGYMDDRASVPWGRTKKLFFDILIAAAASFVLCEFRPMDIWLPFFKGTVTVSWWSYALISTGVIIITVNSTNCSDGVDGLAGSLTLISLLGLGAFLYGVVGHELVAKYLLIPHNPDGARWAILAAVTSGTLIGYLWYNAEPSSVLMGDAGSRPLGLLVGVLVMASGNPILVFAVALIVLINGGTGIIKLLLLLFFGKLGFDIRKTDEPRASHKQLGLIRIAHRVRFPLHDHFRQKGWSKAQILVRFVLLQLLIMPILFLLTVKIR